MRAATASCGRRSNEPMSGGIASRDGLREGLALVDDIGVKSLCFGVQILCCWRVT